MNTEMGRWINKYNKEKGGDRRKREKNTGSPIVKKTADCEQTMMTE